jgi:hypothetical protein
MKQIKWSFRYSDTMDDDNKGRWARIAYAGKFSGLGFYKNRVSVFQIAWITKLHTEKGMKFYVSYKFPSNSDCVFDDLPAAKKAVEKSFYWFLKMCNN